MGVDYALDKVRLPGPVEVGAKIRLHGVVESVEEIKGDGVEMRIAFTVEVEGARKPACVASAIHPTTRSAPYA